MKVKTYHNYLDYINSDENNWSYVRLEDFENAGDKQVKVYLFNHLCNLFNLFFYYIKNFFK